ncbi:MAG TPA: MFS transporter [Tetragenococcus sp.]|nr:MFS transporter [Tetragenococcus sp.]
MENLKKKNSYRLLLLRAFSQFGSSMYEIVLPLLVLKFTGSLSNAGLFYALIKLPSILLLPFLGIFVERFNRKTVLFYCNFLTLVIFTVQLSLFVTHTISIAILALLGMLMNLSYSVSDIATRVIFTEIIPKNQLEKYNGIKSIIDNSAIFIAPMTGTLLYGMRGIEFVLVVILILYSISALGIHRIDYKNSSNIQKKNSHILIELKEGFQMVKNEKTILAFFILTMVLNFFVASSEEIINPGILIAKYQISQRYFGFSSTFFVIGVIFAGIFIIFHEGINFQKQLKKIFITNSLIMILIGVFSLLFINFSKYIYYGIFLFFQILLGFFTIIVNVPLTSYFQANIPVDFQGRFFAFLSFSANLSIPFGISYSGFVAESFGADIAYIINNICVILIVIAVYHRFAILNNKK